MTDVFVNVKERIAEKVRKLLTHAEDPATTPEEAEAFTAKAQHLISRYSIDLAMIAEADRADRLTEGRVYVSEPYGRRKIGLANAVARANDCRGVFTCYRKNGKNAYFLSVIGYESDVEWVQTLYASLEVQLASAMTRDARTRPRSDHGRTWGVNYIEGFAGAVSTRLTQAKRAAAAEAQAAVDAERGDLPTPSTSVALVLILKAERVEKEYKVRHPYTRSTRVYSRGSDHGRTAGATAGRNASLARGAVGGSPAALR